MKGDGVAGNAFANRNVHFAPSGDYCANQSKNGLHFLTLYLKNRKIQGLSKHREVLEFDRVQGPTQAAARHRSPRGVCQHAWTLDALVAAGMLARGNQCLSASVAFSLERCSSPGGLGSAQAFACVACELRTTTRIAGSFLDVGETGTVADDRDSVPVRWEQKGGQQEGLARSVPRDLQETCIRCCTTDPS